ncbi:MULTISPECIES: 5-bromo-4-chloroindolyl phosphate hydrolysis family protein [unclassified Sporosarcina]|uniref:5-bromo-4-chloroindolyl phosphate hydrolysis family protein n=1 Tax=unclassified Sporosarcina TaxID=2647733 RepID=UPI000C166E2E|nr:MULTISPECIES: 5-bromo-4-chloroindolyl phosphate hydrolysis family protein [unclassified Sporosarcina]PID06503.1 5-bromo-4-chloroindolyl phosphate hydrolysis protein [Sporosarcina sp. P30]PID09697.1 5-bromo-4-chloroindolyl phosphate hydrolysis protein [Sporosarcina sp. P31]PID13275.1 5-bromo-4-chloroindolyl phosphate hydrolysis protein [Sporosarcina sp. P32b]
MNNIKNFFTRHVIMAPTSFLTWVILIGGTSINFFLGSAIGIALYAGGNVAIKELQLRSTLKQFGMARSEYKHIEQQLNESKRKLKQLGNMYGQVRSIQAFRQVYDMSSMARRIIKIVQSNPRKFYQVESFFYAHLDSVVELTSKYSLLVNQPLKDQEIKIALQHTRETLSDLSLEMEQDLRNAVSTDLEQLRMEIDYVDITLKRNKPLLESKGEHSNDR